MKNKDREKSRNLVILSITLFVILFMRFETFYSNNLFYSKSATILSLLFSISGFLFFLIPKNGSIVYSNKGIGIYLVLFWLTTIFSTLININSKYIIYDVIVSLTFYLVVYLVCSKLMRTFFNVQQLSNCFFLIEIIFTIIYIVYRFSDIGIGNNTANTIYFIITILPLILINKNTKIQVTGVIIAIFTTLISNKRTAFIMLFVALLLYILMTLLLSRRGIKKKFVLITATLGLAMLIYLVYNYMSERMDINVFYRLSTLIEDGGSGRDIIYKNVLAKIKEFNLMEFLIGNGYNGVFLKSGIGTSAHNDFLEIMYDYGIVGLIIYLSMIWKIIYITFKMFQKNLIVALASVSCLVMFLFMSMFSHLIIYPTYFINILIFWSVLCHENNAY